MCKVRRALAVTQGSGEGNWTRLATVGREGEREARNLRIGNWSWLLEQRGVMVRTARKKIPLCCIWVWGEGQS